MSSEKGPNDIRTKNINCITIFYDHFGGYWEKKKEKKWQQNSLKNIFLTDAVRRTSITLKWLPDFDWLLYIEQLFDSHLYILARQILHFSS